MNIEIEIDKIGLFTGIIDDPDNPKTVETTANALPVTGVLSRWGDEIYFSTDISAPLEKGIDELTIGDIAYWPTGKIICIFFGPTPASIGTEPRAAALVNRIGHITSNIEKLRLVTNKSQIIIRKQ